MPERYAKTRRAQSLIDMFISVFAAMLLWPFPIARAALTPAVHVAGVLATCVVAQLLYYAISAASWRRTVGMHLAGIRLASADGKPPRRGQAVMWGLISAVIAVWFAVAPSSACRAATAERASGTKVY